jgi:F-type H+-transporting ATPase subunit epsilon
MLLEIITPESEIFKGEVEAVQLPGLDGSFQALKGHAPIISGLSKGEVKIDLLAPFERTEKSSNLIIDDKSSAKVIRVAIKGGVIELLNDKIVVLAE